MYSISGQRRLWIAWGAVLVAVAGGRAPATEPLAVPDELRSALQAGPPKTPDQLRLLQTQVRRVVSVARPVTVSVELDDSVGSGVIVSADGLVLTAGHVCVEPNREVWIRFPDNRRVRGRSLGVNHRLDCGMARITEEPPAADEPTAADGAADGAEPDAGWPFVPIAERSVDPGDWVVCLGQPNGFVDGRAPPVRLGRVIYTEKDTINTDATLVGGDSGGPLLNLRGEVVAIHSKIGESLTTNFHVPVTAFRREWARLEAGRMIGVPDGEDPDDWRPLAGLAVRERAGEVVVTQVFPDLPAAQAGVAVGDVLQQVAGEEVGSAAQVDRLVKRRQPFERLPIVVRRDGVTVEYDVWLGRAPVEFPGGELAQEER